MTLLLITCGLLLLGIFGIDTLVLKRGTSYAQNLNWKKHYQCQIINNFYSNLMRMQFNDNGIQERTQIVKD